MSYKILNCGRILENYYACIVNNVVGFTHRVAKTGDVVFLGVNINKNTVCGVRCLIDEITDFKPWADSENYVQCFKTNNMEFCKPFELKALAKVSSYWGLKYMQNSKNIDDESACNLLDDLFNKSKLEKPYNFKESEIKKIIKISINEDNDAQNNLDEDYKQDESLNIDDNVLIQLPEIKLDIMGTFQTIKFVNETDKINGLEPLVNANFYQLFSHFNESKTILFPNNRLFSTVGLENENNEIIGGIQGRPDALLISCDVDKKDSSPLQINLIEYECYGEQKNTASKKFNHLNGHIIPQLMRFASTFSIVTDTKIREKTIREWTKKIIENLEEQNIISKAFSWIREMYPDTIEQQLGRKLDYLINLAFETNIRVLLIIDELTIEQKETIKNIIGAFKLNNSKDNSVKFNAYTIRLEQKICVTNKDAQYALSFQE